MLALSQPSEPIRGVRWRFEYTDKPPKIGIWNYTGDAPELQAWRQSKSNLLFAVIEAKDQNQVIHRIFECPGADFCNFQTEMEARFSMNGGTGQHRMVGLTLVSRTERATIFLNGEIEIAKRASDDFDNHYKYGKV